jgi:hypothetical protein
MQSDGGDSDRRLAGGQRICTHILVSIVDADARRCPWQPAQQMPDMVQQKPRR